MSEELVTDRDLEEPVEGDTTAEPTEVGRSQGGALFNSRSRTWVPTNGGRFGRFVNPGGAERTTDQSDIDGLEAQGGATGSRDRGISRRGLSRPEKRRRERGPRWSRREGGAW